MNVSYKKFWKLLIDRDMKKGDIRQKAGLSISAMAKLGRNENVTMDTISKVCIALDCTPNDVTDIIRDEKITHADAKGD